MYKAKAKNMDKLELLYTASGNIKSCNCLGQLLLEMLPYDPEIPFLGIYTRELKTVSKGFSGSPV